MSASTSTGGPITAEYWYENLTWTTANAPMMHPWSNPWSTVTEPAVKGLETLEFQRVLEELLSQIEIKPALTPAQRLGLIL